MKPADRSKAARPDTPVGAAGPGDTPHTVFVVDDDASFRTGLVRMLRASGYAVSCFASAADFLAGRTAGVAGCVVADLKMPGMDGMALQEALENSEDPLPVVFLSGHGDIRTSVEAIRQGAEDFLTKTAPREELLGAIERALARDSREREARLHGIELQSRFNKLTPRERDVLVHVTRGRTNGRIAADLGVTERSIKRHRTNLMKKLEVRSVAELVLLARDAGII